MAKLLPIVGIVAAVLTAVVAVAVSGIGTIVLPLLAVLAGILALVADRRANMVAGIALIVVGALLAFLAIPGGVSGEEVSVGSSGSWAAWFAVLGGAAAILAVVATRRAAFEPSWVGLACIVAAVVAMALLAWKVEAIGSPTGPDSWALYLAAVLFLGAGAANVVALRDPYVATTTTHTETVVEPAPAAARRRKAAKRKAD